MREFDMAGGQLERSSGAAKVETHRHLERGVEAVTPVSQVRTPPRAENTDQASGPVSPGVPMKRLMLGAAAALACAHPAAATAQESGEVVLAFYERGGSWVYPATVRSVSGDWVTLEWDTGSTSVVNRGHVGVFHWGVGSELNCKWDVDGKFYTARITRMGDDGRTMDIVWTMDNSRDRITTSKCRSAG